MTENSNTITTPKVKSDNKIIIPKNLDRNQKFCLINEILEGSSFSEKKWILSAVTGPIGLRVKTDGFMPAGSNQYPASLPPSGVGAPLQPQAKVAPKRGTPQPVVSPYGEDPELRRLKEEENQLARRRVEASNDAEAFLNVSREIQRVRGLISAAKLRINPQFRTQVGSSGSDTAGPSNPQ